MSDLYPGLAASAVSALVLTALAVRGFGQPAFVRVLDGLLALGFAGYAGYLVRTNPDGVVVYYVFAVPVVAVLLMWPARRRARARRFTTPPPPYADQTSSTPLTPFPPPPAPLGEPAQPGYRPRPSAGHLPERPVSPGPGVTRPPMPSGLAGHHHPEQPTMPGAYQPRPSGLAGHHPAPAADEPAPKHPSMPSGLPHPPSAESFSAPVEPPQSARHAASAEFVSPGHAEPRSPADPRYSTYVRDQEPQTTQFDYNIAQEAGSRLRQPAYLAEYSPTEPHDPGRHRADDAAEPPRDWPPKEWPPPRG